MNPLVFFTVLLLSASPFFGVQAEKDSDAIRPGKLIQGPKIEKGSLDGRVVLFVQWGVTGSFQDLSLPLLQLAREFGPGSFQMILSLDHPEPGKDLLRKLGLEKAAWIKRRVIVTSRGRVSGKNNSGSLPFFALFDHEGKMIESFSGGRSVMADLRRLRRSIQSHVDRIPPIYLGAMPFVETKELADSIRSGKDLQRSLRQLEKQLRQEALETGGKSARYKELKLLMSAVRRHVNTQILVAWDQRVAEPEKGMERLRSLETSLQGTRLYAAVETALVNARVDPVFTQGLRYLRALQLIKTRLDRLRPCKWAALIPNVKLRRFDAACPDCRWGKEDHIRQLEEDLARLQAANKRREIRWRAMSLESAFLAGRKYPVAHKERLRRIREEQDRTHR